MFSRSDEIPIKWRFVVKFIAVILANLFLQFVVNLFFCKNSVSSLATWVDFTPIMLINISIFLRFNSRSHPSFQKVKNQITCLPIIYKLLILKQRKSCFINQFSSYVSTLTNVKKTLNVLHLRSKYFIFSELRIEADWTLVITCRVVKVEIKNTIVDLLFNRITSRNSKHIIQ